MALSTGDLLILSSNTFSLQLIWSLVFSQGAEHLRSQGLSQQSISLLWLFPPCAGMLVPPLCKRLNKCGDPEATLRQLRFASVGTAVALCLFGWCFQVAEYLRRLSDRGPSPGGGISDVSSQAIGTISLIVLSITVQPISYGCRLLGIAMTPRQQQAELNSYYGYMNALGGVTANVAISLLMQRTELKAVPLIASITAIAILSTCAMTISRFHGTAPQDPLAESSTASSFMHFCWRTCRSKSKSFQILRTIFLIQFCCWAAWFSFLYYFSSYSVSASLRRILAESNSIHMEELESTSSGIVQQAHGLASRHASMAFAVFSCLSLLYHAILPKIIANQYDYRLYGQGLISDRLRLLWIGCQVGFAAFLMLAQVLWAFDLGILLATYASFAWTMTQWAPYVIIGWLVHKEKQADSLYLDIGSIVAVMNISVTAPQIIMALINWLVTLVCTRIGVLSIESVLFCIAAIPVWLSVYLISIL